MAEEKFLSYLRYLTRDYTKNDPKDPEDFFRDMSDIAVRSIALEFLSYYLTELLADRVIAEIYTKKAMESQQKFEQSIEIISKYISKYKSRKREYYLPIYLENIYNSKKFTEYLIDALVNNSENIREITPNHISVKHQKDMVYIKILKPLIDYYENLEQAISRDTGLGDNISRIIGEHVSFGNGKKFRKRTGKKFSR